MDLLSNFEYQQLLGFWENNFLSLKNEVNNHPKLNNPPHFMGTFALKFKEIVSELKNSEPESFYFMSELLSLLTMVELLEEGDSESSDLIFEELSSGHWSSHCHIEKKEESYLKAFAFIAKELESFYFNHISEASWQDYIPHVELGDFIQEGRVRKGDIVDITLGDLSLTLKGDGELVKANEDRVKNALRIIQKASPDSYLRLKMFSRFIIPSSREEIVSYSSEYLPFYSIINMTDRDDIDLVDDLLHENGHHHLNMYLRNEELIEEIPDEIFYSPWRKSLRPIRGIYHGFFTFFFAQKIFRDLFFFSQEHPDFFDLNQRQKIANRLIEETLMLCFCIEDIKWAHQNHLITKRGKEIIDPIISKVQSIDQELKKLDVDLLIKARLNNDKLRKELQEKKLFYQKDES